MQLIDTHLHLYAKEFDADRAGVIAAARELGVTHLLLPNINSDSIPGMLQLAGDHPDFCYPMMGLHPCYVSDDFEAELDIVYRELETGRYLAVGEIGMDRFWDLTHLNEQEEALKRQLRWAHQFDLPVALHTREANDEVLAIIRDLALSGLRGVFHCFSGTVEQAHAMIELGFYLGIGGVLTYRNSGLDKVLAEIPMDHLVLETDGPYLAPVPFRGKRNQPAYLEHIVSKLAEIKNISTDEAAAITSANARSLFRL